MISKILVCFTALIVSLNSFAGQIRTIHMNPDKMRLVNLRMGQSTVLRFTDKPKKIVIGNQNYYSVEFIENDVTIQPLGRVKTNLFIYPPQEVKSCHRLITNFHQPCSTLLMLVSAFAGINTIKKAYEYALDNNFRFLSYGDSMLLENSNIITEAR